MATKYRDIIVEGLREYDNNALSTEEYRALAWQGLSDTNYYRDVLKDDGKEDNLLDHILLFFMFSESS